MPPPSESPPVHNAGAAEQSFTGIGSQEPPDIKIPRTRFDKSVTKGIEEPSKSRATRRVDDPAVPKRPDVTGDVPAAQSPSPPATPAKPAKQRAHPQSFVVRQPLKGPNLGLRTTSTPNQDPERPPWKKRMARHAPLTECICPDFEGPNQPRTVLDVVAVKMPLPPDAYKDGVLQGTKKQTQRDVALSTAYQLDNLVYVPHMPEQLFAPISDVLASIPVNLRKPAHVAFLSRVHPYLTLHDMPPVTNSEHDTQEAANKVLVRPALAVFNVVRRWLLSGKQGDPIQLEHDDPTPFAASGAGSKVSSEADSESRGPITDIGIVHLDDMIITGEVKTKNVVGVGEANPMAPIQKLHERDGPDRGMKFIPPKSVSDATGKLARLIIQVCSVTLQSVLYICAGLISQL